MARHALPCLAASALLLAGCYSFVDYVAAANGKAARDLRDITVDPAAYPSYAFTAKFSPPRNLPFPTVDQCIEKQSWEREELKAPIEKIRAECIRYMDGPDMYGVEGMPDVEPGDVWRVSYVVDGYFVISSDSYDRRYCRLSRASIWSRVSSSACDKLQNLLFVDSSGRIASSWVQLDRPRTGRRRLFDRQQTILDPDPLFAKFWSTTPPLRAVKTP